MTKKIIFLLLGIIIVLGLFDSVLSTEKVFASAKQVNIYFFWGEGCPHCDKETLFLERLQREHQNTTVYQYEVWHNSNNRKLLIEAGEKLQFDVSGVPCTVVGDKTFVGFTDGLTSEEIEERVRHCSTSSCPDSLAAIVGVGPKEQPLIQPTETETAESEKSIIPRKIVFPIIGDIETKNLSLPVFTIVLGALDGFNPCAMWTLLFLISLLLGMKDRKRMWILGGAFIIASASVYFMFIAAWLNLLLFVGLVVWVRIIIGLIALTSGGYNLKEYFTHSEAVCKVMGTEKRQKVFWKLKNIIHQQSFYLALGGIIVLAGAVNLVELICSAGLPVIFTQVLALSSLAKWQYYFYMLLYIFVFMLDDLIVFFVAMITLQMTGITTKYTRFSYLIGGVLMAIVGTLLIFKPEWLMFG